MSELVIPAVEPGAWAVRSETGSGATTYRAECSVPFTADQFYGLLEQIAPNAAGDTPNGVIGDWKLPDEAEREKRFLPHTPMGRPLISGQAMELEQLHRPLKQAWDGFMPSRKLFMHLVNDARIDTSFVDKDGEYVRGIHDVLIRPEDVDVDQLISDYVQSDRTVYGILEMLARAAGHTTPKAQKDFATEHLTSFVRGLRGKNKYISTPKSLTRYLESQQPCRVRMLTQQAVYHALKDDPETTKRFREQLTNTYCAPITVDGQPYLYRKSRVVASLDKAMVDSEEISNGSARARVARVRVRSDGNDEYQRYGSHHSQLFILPGTVEPVESRPMSTITPVVRWLKNAEGSRQFILDEPITPNTSKLEAYESNLFGVLVLAHLCPDVRERWPKEIGLPGSRFKQAMGIAQVPVLALFEGTKRKLLQSEPIRQWEQAVTDD